MANFQKMLLMYQPSPKHFQKIRSIIPNAEIAVAHSEEEAQILISDANVVWGNRYFLQALPYAHKLKWMQSNSMGVDLILNGAGDKLDGIILTSAKGLYKDEVADHAMALLLGITRGLPNAIQAYHHQEWGRWTLKTLNGLSALVIGWGATGKAIGERLQGFGVNVQGVRRSIYETTIDKTGCPIHTRSSWYDVLPQIDILIVATPLTLETQHLINRQVIDALPNDAVVINIARGEIIDETALFDALCAGSLLGAGLDTLSQEPPPKDHHIWTVPSLLLTPHVARSLEQPPYKWEDLFIENLYRYTHDEPLLNVVDKELGY